MDMEHKEYSSYFRNWEKYKIYVNFILPVCIISFIIFFILFQIIIILGLPKGYVISNIKTSIIIFIIMNGALIFSSIMAIYLIFPLVGFFLFDLFQEDPHYKITLEEEKIVMQYKWPPLEKILIKNIFQQKIINQIEYNNIKKIYYYNNRHIRYTLYELRMLFFPLSGKYGRFYHPGVRKKNMILIELKRNIPFNNFVFNIDGNRILRNKNKISNMVDHLIIDINDKDKEEFLSFIKGKI